jgi:hypothetical protein
LPLPFGNPSTQIIIRVRTPFHGDRGEESREEVLLILVFFFFFPFEVRGGGDLPLRSSVFTLAVVRRREEGGVNHQLAYSPREGFPFCVAMMTNSFSLSSLFGLVGGG